MSSTRAAEFMQRRDDWNSFAVVASHLGLVFAPVFVAAYFGSWPWLLAGYIWFGLTQHSVALLMHEAAHRMVFSKARWSDALGHWIVAPSFLTNFELYRRRHWVHHHHAGTVNDTKEIYLIEFRGFAGFLAFVFRCLFGIEAVRLFATTLKENEFVTPLTKAMARQGFIGLVTFQAVFASSLFGVALVGAGGDFVLALIHSALAYGVVYLYGMASGTVLLATLRAIAEHQIVPEATHIIGKAAIRNLAPTPITRAMFGSYGFCEHGTHHVHPAIPYYNLPNATQSFSRSDSSLAYGPSYWGIIARTVRVPHIDVVRRLDNETT